MVVRAWMKGRMNKTFGEAAAIVRAVGYFGEILGQNH
jgi:hypothetical protein